MSELARVLAGFHAAVTGAAPLADARALIEDDGDGLARLRVYAHAYTARIAGVLVADYPKLEALTGRVRALTPDYLRAHPPAHPSLREVGRDLAGFLAVRGEPPHLVELARLERARLEAFDGGRDVTPLGRDDLARLAPEDFPGLRLALVPSAQLVALAWNADELWDALEEDRPPPTPRPLARAVLVWRREVTVVHRTLEADEAPVLTALAAGASFAAACEPLAAQPAADERAVSLLLRWLDAGVLSSGAAAGASPGGEGGGDVATGPAGASGSTATGCSGSLRSGTTTTSSSGDGATSGSVTSATSTSPSVRVRAPSHRDTSSIANSASRSQPGGSSTAPSHARP